LFFGCPRKGRRQAVILESVWASIVARHPNAALSQGEPQLVTSPPDGLVARKVCRRSDCGEKLFTQGKREVKNFSRNRPQWAILHQERADYRFLLWSAFSCSRNPLTRQNRFVHAKQSFDLCSFSQSLNCFSIRDLYFSHTHTPTHIPTFPSRTAALSCSVQCGFALSYIRLAETVLSP
jgi:hypothetical protein